jgi:hypothetical protein
MGSQRFHPQRGDSLPPGAWIKRKSLPARPGPVDQEMVERLESELIEYFSTAEHRGTIAGSSACEVEMTRSSSRTQKTIPIPTSFGLTGS